MAESTESQVVCSPVPEPLEILRQEREGRVQRARVADAERLENAVVDHVPSGHECRA